MGKVLNEARGGSGATIELLMPNTVRKYGTSRVGEEGYWLKRNQKPGIVKVRYVSNEAYEMERLDPHPGFASGFSYAATVASILAFDVWVGEPRYTILHATSHRERLQPLVPHLEKHIIEITQLYFSIPWNNLVLVNTHGDPIADNVMRRGDFDVLIDPIPSTSAIPDFLAVDVGRIIQSCVGYEQARYGVGFDPVERIDRIIELCYRSTNRRLERYEIMACYYFAVFHLARACADRRATDEIRARLYPLIDRIMKEAAPWMSSFLPEDVAVG